MRHTARFLAREFCWSVLYLTTFLEKWICVIYSDIQLLFGQFYDATFLEKSWLRLYGWRHTPLLQPPDDDNQIIRLNTLPPNRRFNSRCRNLPVSAGTLSGRLRHVAWLRKTTQLYEDSSLLGCWDFIPCPYQSTRPTHPRTLESPSIPLWEPQILQHTFM